MCILQKTDKTWLLLRRARCSEGETAREPREHQCAAGGDDEEKIAYPTLELWRHTLLRGANMGSVCSIVLGVPVLLIRGVRQPVTLLRRLANISPYGVVSMSS